MKKFKEFINENIGDDLFDQIGQRYNRGEGDRVENFTKKVEELEKSYNDSHDEDHADFEQGEELTIGDVLSEIGDYSRDFEITTDELKSIVDRSPFGYEFNGFMKDLLDEMEKEERVKADEDRVDAEYAEMYGGLDIDKELKDILDGLEVGEFMTGSFEISGRSKREAIEKIKKLFK